VTTSVQKLPEQRAALQPRKHGIAVFVLIDALGWQILQNRDFLCDYLPYRRPLQTILGFSSGAIPTILTGTSPAEHGHWNLFYYDPDNSPFKWLRFFHFLPDSILDNRVSRKIIKELGRRFLGMGPLFDCAVSPRVLPFFNWVEKRNIYDKRGITGAPSIFDNLERNQIGHRVYTYHHATDAEILGQAERDLRAGAAQFYFLYLSEMDMFLHLHRTDANAIDERLRWYDERLRQVFAVAREVDPDASLAVLSDHGMTPVQNYYDLLGDVEKLGLAMPKDYLAVYDSTMARFWFFNEAARDRILGTLRAVTCGRLLPDDELQRMGVFFDDRRFGEAIFLLDPGWLFSRSDFDWAPVGMHGYHPDDADSDAVFLANREPSANVTTIKDVYQCMWEAACGAGK
jgi:predicted AlkP superfamily pyrophosphatase or phosphodiesterase